MKVVPLIPTAHPSANPMEGRSASAERLARATAAAQGPQSAIETPRAIKMNTNATPPPNEIAAPAPAVVAAEGSNPDNTETAQPTPEDPGKVSPDAALVAKAKRALQVRDKEIADLKAKLEANVPAMNGEFISKADFESDPLGTMLKNGVTYQRLTQQVLDSMEGGGPALTRVEKDLRDQIKRLETSLEEQTNSQKTAAEQAQEKTLQRMQREANQLIAQDDNYTTIRDSGNQAKVSTLIKRLIDTTGEEISVKEACDLIETDLVEQGTKFANFKKVQAKLQSSQQTQAQPTHGQPAAPQMRTLTNQDTVVPAMSRRDRAMAAALGKKIA